MALVVVPQAAELVPARAAVLLVARPVAVQLQAVVQPLVLGVLRQVRVVLQPVAQLLQAALPQPVVQLPLALEPLLRRVLPLREVAGHSEVAPGRKFDPGAGFDWARLLARLAQT